MGGKSPRDNLGAMVSIIAKTLAIIIVIAVLAGAPAVPAAAHGGIPVETKQGVVTLYPSGSTGSLLHSFGFTLQSGDGLKANFTVNFPSAAKVDFSVHVHNATSTVEVLNLTAVAYDGSVQAAFGGFYMPQWLNMHPFAINVTYGVQTVHVLSQWDLIFGLLIGFAPLLALGAAAAGFYVWGRRRKLRGSQLPTRPVAEEQIKKSP